MGSRRLGFTLIELLVVLAVVSTLLLLVAPRYVGRLDQTREAVLRENLRVTRGVLDKFHADLGRYPDSLQELVDRNYLRALPYDPVAESSESWTVVPAPDGYAGAVFDVRSGATGVAHDGSRYADW